LKDLLFFNGDKKKLPTGIKIFNVMLIVLTLGLGLFLAFKQINYNYMWKDVIFGYKDKFINGFFLTIFISFFSLIAALIVGTVTALCQRSNFLPLHYLAKTFIEVVRGTPLLVQIYLFYYVVGTALKIENRYFVGIIIMSLFSGAYIAEIIRAGIESIGKNQLETSKALGFTKFQKYRYVIFPQVFKSILPPLAGQFASLIKDSSLLSIIAVNEFTKNVQEVDSLTFAPVENYTLLAVGYLILTFPISFLTKRLERKFKYEN